MRKIKVNSRALMAALIAKGVTAKYAAAEMKIPYSHMKKFIQQDKGVQAPTANKLIEYFGEQVVYIDEGRAESSTDTARTPTAKGESPSADKRNFVVDGAAARRLATSAKTYTEDRSFDDLSY